MDAAEHVPGHDAEVGLSPLCPKCDCPEVTLIAKTENERTTNRGKKILVIRRQRRCENENCSAVFWTTQQIEL
jgi:hypothetical protein